MPVRDACLHPEARVAAAAIVGARAVLGFVAEEPALRELAQRRSMQKHWPPGTSLVEHFSNSCVGSKNKHQSKIDSNPRTIPVVSSEILKVLCFFAEPCLDSSQSQLPVSRGLSRQLSLVDLPGAGALRGPHV